MTDEELKELVASLAVAQRETDRQLKETDRQLRRQLKELGNRLCRKRTEGMALPSMTKILTENFGDVGRHWPRVKVRKAGRSLELDVLAYANSECNAAYVSKSKVTCALMGLSNFRTFWSSSVSFFQNTPTRLCMGFWQWLIHRMICDRKHCQQEFSWLGSMTSSSSWRCPKIFSPNPGEPQFERFAAFLFNTKTAILPLLNALLRRAYHLLSGKPSYLSSSRAKRGDLRQEKALMDCFVRISSQ